jgi:hypothetical protein
LNFLAIYYSVSYEFHDRTERIQRIERTRYTHSAHTLILLH